MEYPVVGSSMAHSDRELRLHQGTQKGSLMQPLHAIAESWQEPTPDEKWDGDISGTVPFLDAFKYIVVFCSNKNKYNNTI